MAYFPMVLPFFLMPFAPVGDPMALIKGPFLMIYAIAVPLAMGWSAVTSYTATSVPGNVQVSGASSPISKAAIALSTADRASMGVSASNDSSSACH